MLMLKTINIFICNFLYLLAEVIWKILGPVYFSKSTGGLWLKYFLKHKKKNCVLFCKTEILGTVNTKLLKCWYLRTTDTLQDYDLQSMCLYITFSSPYLLPKLKRAISKPWIIYNTKRLLTTITVSCASSLFKFLSYGTYNSKAMTHLQLKCLDRDTKNRVFVRSGLFWNTTQRWEVVLSRNVGT